MSSSTSSAVVAASVPLNCPLPTPIFKQFIYMSWKYGNATTQTDVSSSASNKKTSFKVRLFFVDILMMKFLKFECVWCFCVLLPHI